MIKQQVFKLLDRKGLRWLIAQRQSRRFSEFVGQPVHVYYSGNWVHKHASGYVVNTRPTPVSPKVQAERASDICFHDYDPQLGDIVVDVGAGIGSEIGVFSKKVGPNGRVVAIEAHPKTFSCLEQCVELNKYENVTVIHCAIAEADGTLLISDDPKHIGNSIVDGKGQVEVPAFSLDSLAEDLSLTRIDYLKMNIEGAETSALKGMPWMLSRTKRVCISCHDFKADRTGIECFRTRHEVIKLLEKSGFALRFREDTRPFARDYVYGTN